MDSVARDRWPEDPRQITLPFSYILNPFFCILTVRFVARLSREGPSTDSVASHFRAPRAPPPPRAARPAAPAADQSAATRTAPGTPRSPMREHQTPLSEFISVD